MYAQSILQGFTKGIHLVSDFRSAAPANRRQVLAHLHFSQPQSFGNCGGGNIADMLGQLLYKIQIPGQPADRCSRYFTVLHSAPPTVPLPTFCRIVPQNRIFRKCRFYISVLYISILLLLIACKKNAFLQRDNRFRSSPAKFLKRNTPFS